jgi:ubiquinone/menaquinone biosynthesis C-methylase UbiE
MNPIIETYSQLANEYDGSENSQSCWGRASDKAMASIRLKDAHRRVVDIGCGSGRALIRLAAESPHEPELIGVEPAPNMRHLAIKLTRHIRHIRILDGAFEQIPIESGTVDYLYSILAFHWTTDVHRTITELHRVLKHDGEMDLFFIGRNNGHEFIRKTTPIFLKYMGPILLLKSAAMRKQLPKEAALQLFQKVFDRRRVSVDESYETYYDSLEGHWSWWLRIEGHFVQLPPEKRTACDREVKDALATLRTPAGIPYTIHMLHVKL